LLLLVLLTLLWWWPASGGTWRHWTSSATNVQVGGLKTQHTCCSPTQHSTAQHAKEVPTHLLSHPTAQESAAHPTHMLSVLLRDGFARPGAMRA